MSNKSNNEEKSREATEAKRASKVKMGPNPTIVGDEADLPPAAPAAQASHGSGVNASASPSPEEVKDRLMADRRRGPSSPLYRLAKVEADLHDRSASLAKLSPKKRNQPGRELLVDQLPRAINTANVARTRASELRRDAVAVYSALRSEDLIESILNQHIVAISSRVMDCHARAAQTTQLKAADVYLRHVEMGTKSLIQLVEARERRRSPKQVTVGQVNVEAGGQAIVGNVEAAKEKTPPRKGNCLDPSLQVDEDDDD